MIHHDELYPGEAFDPETTETSSSHVDDPSEISKHFKLVQELGVASRAIRDSGKYELDSRGFLSKESEAGLAKQIQDGVEAEARAQLMGDEYDGSFDSTIELANQARADLVLANLPFAAYMARQSVGFGPVARTMSTPQVAYSDADYMGMRNGAGTYMRIANLAHSRASLDDRTNVAMEAMWIAAGKFKPQTVDPTSGRQPAKFMTYAAHEIQQRIARHIASEVGGWDVAHHVLEVYQDALKQQAAYGGMLPEIRHIGLYDGRHVGYHPDVVFEGRKSVPADSVDSFAATEEADDWFDDAGLSLSEVVPGSNADAPEEIAVQKSLSELLGKVFATLSDREAGVIQMRFGLDDGTPKTLDEIAAVYGVTRERIRQIESKTMSKLRHPSRSESLRDYIDDIGINKVSPTVMEPLVVGAVNVKTKSVNASPRRIHTDDSTQGIANSSDPLESWQLYPGEEWELETAIR